MKLTNKLSSYIYVLLALVFASALAEAFKANANDQTFEDYTKQSLLWAPYRSNLYFGLRPRYVKQSPLVIGVMWFDSSNKDGLVNLRHHVSQEDKMSKYSWEVYDPRLGGTEVIIDDKNNMNVTFSFVKSNNGENWAVRVHGTPIDPKKPTAASMIVYFNQNGEDQMSQLVNIDSGNPNDLEFLGISKQMGEYELNIKDNYGKYFVNPSMVSMEVAPGSDSSKTSHFSMNVPDLDVWKARDIFQSLVTDSVNNIVETQTSDFHSSLIPSLFTIRNIHGFREGNFHFVQKTFLPTRRGFEFDITYNKANSKQKINGRKVISGLISKVTTEIKAKFDRVFDIKDRSDEYEAFALETLSNLLGGIGYFHGTQMVDRKTELDEDTFNKITFKNPIEEGPLELFTSVPSRGFFPRGFYWDEGFHLLQVMEYDYDLAFEIIMSWFNLIEEETGWVAREVTLGDEARSKVPPEFTTQSLAIANPPTLLLTFSEMLTRAIQYQESINVTLEAEETSEHDTNQLEKNLELLVKYAKAIYPKLSKHYEWFRSSQKGSFEEYEEIFEDEGILGKIHPDELYRWAGRTKEHCLPSGLDDYPRAQPPDMAELNVDTMAWVGVMTKSMKQIAHILELSEDEARYAKIEKKIVENLDSIHWSEKDGCYCDITIDDFDDARSFVCHQGYISVLPFALKLIPANSPKLAKIIALMGDEDKLFSAYGLRSLSKQDEYFRQGEDYWRGKVWMNINYLCLDALKHYYPESTVGKTTESKNELPVTRLYRELKNNLIENVYKVWKETGFCYENYDPADGAGTGAEQFTGWTALIVNIMGAF